MSGTKNIYKIMVAMATVMLMACEDPRTYDHFEHTDTTAWDTEDALSFDVPRQWEGSYDVVLGLRSTLAYPYQNLSVVVETTVLPSHKEQCDTVNLTINDQEGRPAGQSGISISEIKQHVTTLTLQRSDSLHISVHHLMRRNSLPGISEVGITLSKR